MKLLRGACTAVAAALAVSASVHAQSAPAGHVVVGKVAWYGADWNGRRTASGEPFDAAALTMAHRSLPFGTRVKVTNLANRRSVTVRVNDRGPVTPGRVADVSQAAAQQLRMLRSGVITARLEVLGRASKTPG